MDDDNPQSGETSGSAELQRDLQLAVKQSTAEARAVFIHASESAPRIGQIYTIFSRIPVAADTNGQIYTNALWALDLQEHLAYTPNLHLCCPLYQGVPLPDDWVAVVGLTADRIHAVREDGGTGSVIANIVPNFLSVARAVRRTDVAHGGLAGWAFPLDYYLLLLRPFMRFKWLVNMESSFWLMQKGGKSTLRERVRHHVHLFLGRACMRAADGRMFTQDWYREIMLGSDRRNTLINEAVWVKDEDLLDETLFEARAAMRTGPVRLLLPTRLVKEKGITSVLDAITEADKKLAASGEGPKLIIDVIGTGPMESDVRAFIAAHPARAIKVSFLDAVPYGAPFFELLGRYEAIIVANLKEEQPRIIYDGFSQGLPSIASRTTGIMQIVKDDETAMVFVPGDSAELADRLIQAASSRGLLRHMGREGLHVAQTRTHGAMHRERAHFLVESLGLA